MPSVRILVVGDAAVGKSTLMHLLCECSPAPVWPPTAATLGCATHVALHPLSARAQSAIASSDSHNIKSSIAHLEFFDLSGHSKYALTRQFFFNQNYNAILLCYDAKQRHTRLAQQQSGNKRVSSRSHESYPVATASATAISLAMQQHTAVPGEVQHWIDLLQTVDTQHPIRELFDDGDHYATVSATDSSTVCHLPCFVVGCKLDLLSSDDDARALQQSPGPVPHLNHTALSAVAPSTECSQSHAALQECTNRALTQLRAWFDSIVENKYNIARRARMQQQQMDQQRNSVSSLNGNVNDAFTPVRQERTHSWQSINNGGTSEDLGSPFSFALANESMMPQPPRLRSQHDHQQQQQFNSDYPPRPPVASIAAMTLDQFMQQANANGRSNYAPSNKSQPQSNSFVNGVAASGLNRHPPPSLGLGLQKQSRSHYS